MLGEFVMRKGLDVCMNRRMQKKCTGMKAGWTRILCTKKHSEKRTQETHANRPISCVLIAKCKKVHRNETRIPSVGFIVFPKGKKSSHL